MLHILRFLLRHDFHVEVIRAQDVFIILRDLFVFDAVVVVIHLLLFHFSDLAGVLWGSRHGNSSERVVTGDDT